MKEIIHYACQIEDAALDEMRGDDFINLFMAAVEVNGDFLIVRVQQMLVRFEEMIKLRSQSSSLSSSETVTPLNPSNTMAKAS